MEDDKHYTYIMLDPREQGVWTYKDWTFTYRPFYVGKGKKKRVYEHKSPSQRKRLNIKNTFMDQIEKDLGIEPFYLKLYENISDEKSKEIEMDIISHFGRIDLKTGILANMTKGGEGVVGRILGESELEKMRARKGPNSKSKRINQLDLDGNLIKTWDYLRLITDQLGFSGGGILKCCRGEKRTVGGYRWEFEGTSPYIHPLKDVSVSTKTIYQYDLEGNYITYFRSCAEASKSLGKGDNGSPIGMCGNGKARSVYGYQWFFDFRGEKTDPVKRFGLFLGEAPEPKPIKIRPSQKKPVFQYDFSGNFIREYSCAQEANDILGISVTQIAGCCRGDRQSAGSFIWFYNYQGHKIPVKLTKTNKIVELYNESGEIVMEFFSASAAARAKYYIHQTDFNNRLPCGLFWRFKSD